MANEIELDLNDSTPAKKSKVAKPSLAEVFYAQRLVEGLHPEVLLDDKTVNEGVKEAMTEIIEGEHAKHHELKPIERLGKWLAAGDVPESAVNLAKQLGYEGSLTVGELEDGIRFYHRRTTEDCIEMGKRLLLLKEATAHGEFSQRVELLGINDSLARKFMRAAEKFSNRFSKTVLNKAGSQTKFLELLVLDDDEIEILEAGGEVRGIDLDAIECMSVTELRARLRELEKSTGSRLSNMTAEIERTEYELTRLKNKQRLTKFEDLTELVRDECMHLQAGCELNLNSLQKLFEQVFYDQPTPEQSLRIEQVYIAITVAASRSFSNLEIIQELMTNSGLSVDRIKGQNILTPTEAERWLLDSQMLASKHEAEKLARDVKREEAKPKGRGRPAGSKNKSED